MIEALIVAGIIALAVIIGYLHDRVRDLERRLTLAEAVQDRMLKSYTRNV